MHKHILRVISSFWTLFAIIGLDQLLKSSALRDESTTYWCNPGIAFSLPLPSTIFWVVGVMLVIFFVRKYLTTQKASLSAGGYVMILGGALSNMIDRLIHGCVIDHFALGALSKFNFADVAITVGVIMLLIDMLAPKK